MRTTQPRKGTVTRAAVLAHGLDIASELGLESLTIGTLADRAGMSKSGLYAHFASKEDLQCAVLDAGADRFIDAVMVPALRAPRGLPRIEAIQRLWMQWETDVLPGGCPFIAAASDYDDREGPVRDRTAHHIGRMVAAVERAAGIAIDEGHFRADLDLAQYAFEMWCVIVGYHQHARMLRRPDAASRALTALEELNARAA
ncbi:TetR/AcrR family transcriptional regulator [Demequina sp. NBRC 110053]|uniref:TetR/AcrR family transcriptional regulator n=1 Tax=Demequina sp. NBRC 110053 TaxID=1570342 RepID=UPI0009FD7AB5|nr:TetR/AcrR family transcriptional regulator [Demequina sp. NBRC 110053]